MHIRGLAVPKPCRLSSDYRLHRIQSVNRASNSFQEDGLSAIWASCSKLTTSLVNVSFKLKKLNSTNPLLFFVEKNVRIFCAAKDSHIFYNVRIFCTAKDSHIFSTINSGGFDNLVSIYLTN